MSNDLLNHTQTHTRNEISFNNQPQHCANKTVLQDSCKTILFAQCCGWLLKDPYISLRAEFFSYVFARVLGDHLESIRTIQTYFLNNLCLDSKGNCY